MFCRVYSVALRGIDAVVISVEVDSSAGIPYFDMTGYLSVEVREAKERVRAAIKNSGIVMKPQRVVINLSPADIRKSGTGFDLAMAVGVILSDGTYEDTRIKDVVMIGELGLDGSVKGVKGVLSLLLACRKQGLNKCIVPVENLKEGSCVSGMEVYGVEHISQIVEYIKGKDTLIKAEPLLYQAKEDCTYPDFCDVRGQIAAKRATLIAVSGMHNIMYVGTPGSGKTMMSRRIPGIMPDMSAEEQIELTRIYSVAGLIDNTNPIVQGRPFRSPHHSITMPALLGGGVYPKPGEITLANKGVLFLDEITEYSPQVMESLRQPLEDRVIRINRMSGDYTFPADCMLVAAMNPCRCGYYPDRSKCNCTEADVKRFMGKISRPLRNRFDIQVHIDTVDYKSICVSAFKDSEADVYSEADTYSEENMYTSERMKAKVMSARSMQEERFKGSTYMFNAQMDSKMVEKICVLGKKEADTMQMAYEKLHMTVRGYHKVLKVARTIADIEGEERISVKHISEAISYRSDVDG